MVGVKGADATGVFCQDNIPEPRAKRPILSSMNGDISTVEPLGDMVAGPTVMRLGRSCDGQTGFGEPTTQKGFCRA